MICIRSLAPMKTQLKVFDSLYASLVVITGVFVGSRQAKTHLALAHERI